MKEIKLTQGQVALVDDLDFEALNVFKWYASKERNRFYAARHIYIDGKGTTAKMHNMILNGKGIDHIDHDGLNNQRSNLRFCTKSENNMNQRKLASATSMYKGVSFFKQTGKWAAYIKFNGKKIHLGLFDSEVEAAMSYNDKAIALFCEFANLNKL